MLFQQLDCDYKMFHKPISSQTLQRDASDYEKTEFLKEACLMR